MKEKVVIGRVEKVKFPQLKGVILHARIDTGAKTSSIWAAKAEETQDGLRVQFGYRMNGMNHTEQLFAHYDRVRVASSMGHEQVRYRIKMPIIIRKRRIYATFTLADRSKQVYPVLIGRNTLLRKFVVDVSLGSPLRDEELRRSEILQACIKEEHI